MEADKNVFPCEHSNTVCSGLSARDYIAIQAMEGLLASAHIRPDASMDDIAKDSYMLADALIKQSEAKDEQSV